MNRADDGSILPLVAFFVMVAALLAAVVVDASAAFLAHRELSAYADATALAAAQAVDLDAYYAGDWTGSLPLGDVEAAAWAYAREHLPPDIAVDSVAAESGTVRVTLRRALRFRLATALLPGEALIEATASARLTTR